MRNYIEVDKWYKEVDRFFPDFEEDIKIRMAIIICDELDYIRMMGCQKPGGLFQKLGLPEAKSEPAGIIDGDFLKFLH